MKRLVIAATLLCTTPGFAQDILAEPPRVAIEFGLRLESGIVYVFQQASAILNACGADQPFGCITWVTTASFGGPTCQARIWIGLEGELRSLVSRNLVAQCGGWTPPVRLVAQ